MHDNYSKKVPKFLKLLYSLGQQLPEWTFYAESGILNVPLFLWEEVCSINVLSQDHLFLCHCACGEFELLCETKFKSFTYSAELLEHPHQLNHLEDDFSKVT